jgi:ATP-dependent DNA helicase RecG
MFNFLRIFSQLSMKMDPRTSVVSEEEKILKLMMSDDSISIEKVSREIGISKAKVETAVKKLGESGRLERVGGKRGGHWIVK